MSSQSFMNMESIKKSISAIDISERPDFMTPKPRSPKKVTPALEPEIESVLGKRKYKNTFEEATFEDARYDQHISVNFFETNMGHTVIQQANISAFQRATDQVIEDFRRNFQTAIPILRRERDSESKFDQEELLAWCEYYLANKNLFNV